MTRVGLVSDTWGGEGDNPIENPDLIVAFASLTQSASYLKLEVLRQLGFINAELNIKSRGSEVIDSSPRTTTEMSRSG